MNLPLTNAEPLAIIRLKAVEYALTLLARQSGHSSPEQVLDVARRFEDYVIGIAGSEKSSAQPSAHPGVTGRRGSA